MWFCRGGNQEQMNNAFGDWMLIRTGGNQDQINNILGGRMLFRRGGTQEVGCCFGGVGIKSI